MVTCEEPDEKHNPNGDANKCEIEGKGVRNEKAAATTFDDSTSKPSTKSNENASQVNESEKDTIKYQLKKGTSEESAITHQNGNAYNMSEGGASDRAKKLGDDTEESLEKGAMPLFDDDNSSNPTGNNIVRSKPKVVNE